ncbi:MAG: chromosomal replication initiator protein DnaA [Lachnospiraceae bacterium]|jgi:chromosomal replication initiator protein|nr:chromosomal replication initiator protein DnaA [Lachnospiraceae bacterium]MCI6664990.1 chromosomal replication initiator protein DnaA [Lachnospiraceae bacterium]MDD7224473.1 chromosomal replication initiator protein DnaA [Lachnospiraceae bacterium]MDY3254047.1 chromosomal replication initiator protein DnaA [Lachnospiraceae bacterium]MDY5216632.1 chromosomal replication initiator protein DnaA [Lachnospiraceae bacterium]
MELIQSKWDEILEYIKNEYNLSDISFNTWIKPLKFHSVENNKVIIIIPFDQSHSKNYISSKYSLPIKVSITEVTGMEYDVEFILEKDASSEDTLINNNIINTPEYENTNLNHTYTFDTFVVGSNNRFAQSAALAVAESPGETYNPLFIYGGVGLGKTHLMHAIANYIISENPGKKVLYVTSEQFTNDIIDALRNGNSSQNAEAMSKFRDKYRNIDVLLVDDIQFIIGKERTQEEFFHTFNQLHEQNKQIIISSDKPPKEMEVLEERYRSRFAWGLIADIQQPDYETRMAILKKKKEKLNKEYKESISDEVIDYIANNVTSNVRELEGALNKLIMFSKLENRDIDLSLAKEALKDVISPIEPIKITPEYILEVVCDQFNISPDDVCSKKRNAEIVLPRQIIMYLCRKYTDAPQIKIALLCGKKDHTTVIHAEEKIKELIDVDEYTKNTIDTIIKKINP